MNVATLSQHLSVRLLRETWVRSLRTLGGYIRFGAAGSLTAANPLSNGSNAMPALAQYRLLKDDRRMAIDGWGVAVVAVFELVARHFAFDDARVGARAAPRE